MSLLVCPGALFPRGSFGRGDFCPGGLLPGGTFSPGVFWPGGFLSGGAFVRGVFCPGAYARSPQVQCVYAPSRLSVPSIVAWRTNKKSKRQTTRPNSSAGSRTPLPKFSGYVEAEAQYIFHPSTIWVRPLFTELGLKKTPRSRFCHEANEYVALAVTWWVIWVPVLECISMQWTFFGPPNFFPKIVCTLSPLPCSTSSGISC